MKALLAIKNEDTYSKADARDIIAALYNEFRRNDATFSAVGLAEVGVKEDGEVEISPSADRPEAGAPAFERLIALADALHTTGDLRIILDRKGKDAARKALESYLAGTETARPAQAGQFARQSEAAASLTTGLSDKAAQYCRASLKRVRDFHALSALLPEKDRPLLDMAIAVILECSHRVDDYYDNDAKWTEYGCEDADAAIDEALSAVEELLEGKEFQVEFLRQAKECLEYLKTWVGGDSHASDLNLEDASRRILECNADLYRRFFRMCALATDADASLCPVFEAFGALVWVLDDWRDLEADALNDHFNVFTPVRMDVRAQTRLLEDYFSDLLKEPRARLTDTQLEEFITSAGTTPVMQKYLDLTA